MVPIAYASSEGSGEPAHPRKITSALTAHIHIEGMQMKVHALSNSYTMDCPPVHGNNPQALASGLSYVHVDKYGITILYHMHRCRPCTSQDISF